MTLRILSQPSDPQETVRALERAIAEALPGATVEVAAQSPGHFALRVVSERFRGEGRVRQQQLVYGAIAPLMQGDAASVHAIDRLVTETPS